MVIMTVGIGHEIPFQSQFAIGIVSFLGREKVFSKSVVLGKSIVSVENYTYQDRWTVHFSLDIFFKNEDPKQSWVDRGRDGSEKNWRKGECDKNILYETKRVTSIHNNIYRKKFIQETRPLHKIFRLVAYGLRLSDAVIKYSDKATSGRMPSYSPPSRKSQIERTITLSLHPEASNGCIQASAQLDPSFSHRLKPSSWNGAAHIQPGSSSTVNPIKKLRHGHAMANLDSSLLRAPSQLILECAKTTVKTNHYSYICKCDSKFMF